MTTLRFAVLVLLTPPVCNIPVFRYALERWKPSVYELVVFHRGPLPDADRMVVDALRDLPVNVELDRVDVAGPVEPRWRDFAAKHGAASPFAALFFPGTTDLAWKGPLDLKAIVPVLDSPSRKEIVNRLLSGDSAVWLFLPAGKPEEDGPARKILETELAKLEKSLKLPPLTAADPALLLPAPLKLSFPIFEVRRDDPAEAAFIQLLLKTDTGLQGPVAFPIFGRGRALWALAGKGFHPDPIGEAAAFLAGACSCEAKELNPGLDLPFNVDWDAAAGAVPDAFKAPPVVLPAKRNPEPPPAGEAHGDSRAILKWAAAGAGLLVLATGRRLLRGKA
jgi:hypothetical protein